MRHAALFIVVSGPPGSGKSTLAPGLATECRLPMVAKDTIKEALMTALSVPDLEASRRLGQAAVDVMLAVAAASPIGAVLESNFHRSLAKPRLQTLPGTVVEVFCRCDRDTAVRRYDGRAAARHAGHFDRGRRVEDVWNAQVSEPVAGGWPVVEVNTDHAVDPAVVARRIRTIVDG